MWTLTGNWCQRSWRTNKSVTSAGQAVMSKPYIPAGMFYIELHVFTELLESIISHCFCLSVRFATWQPPRKLIWALTAGAEWIKPQVRKLIIHGMHLVYHKELEASLALFLKKKKKKHPRYNYMYALLRADRGKTIYQLNLGAFII